MGSRSVRWGGAGLSAGGNGCMGNAQVTRGMLLLVIVGNGNWQYVVMEPELKMAVVVIRG